jgi:hypothetical protein
MAAPLLQLELPAGYAFEFDAPQVLPDDLYDRLLIWEAPRPRQLYVLGVDIGDGIGLDRSVIDVLRVGTLEEPDEQVAQFVSNQIEPIDFAPIVDAVGRLYQGSDNQEALAAIEINNHGMVTQAELMHHYGYSNFYIWQYEDAADQEKRYSQRVGWVTSMKTRPLILSRYLSKLKKVGVDGLRDYRINSPLTMEELRSFITQTGAVRDAEADPTVDGAFDDCIMAGAISLHISFTMQWEDREPLDVQRRRRAEEKRRQVAFAEADQIQRDFQNTESTSAEMMGASPGAPSTTEGLWWGDSPIHQPFSDPGRDQSNEGEGDL